MAHSWLDHRHDTPYSIEGRIFKLFFPLQCREPSLDLQRFDTERNSVAPYWKQAVPQDSLVTFYSCVCLWVMDSERSTSSCAA
jgi:hypothetical protein